MLSLAKLQALGPQLLPQTALLLARQDLAAGIHEVGNNGGPLIKKYHDEFHRQPGESWCACATGFWFREAHRSLPLTSPLPISFHYGAKATMAQFQAAGRWIPVAELHPDFLFPGLVPVWHRGPRDAWTGHIGILDVVGDSMSFFTLEGNAGPRADRVYRAARTLTDPNLLGMGYAGELPALDAVA